MRSWGWVGGWGGRQRHSGKRRVLLGGRGAPELSSLLNSHR